MGSRNATVDISKYIAAMMVVAIHTSVLFDVNDTLYFIVVHIICRMAVPFFAICSGYFIGMRCKFKDKMLCTKENKNIFRWQWKKIAVMYTVLTVVYLIYSIPAWINTGWFSFMAFVDYAVATVTVGSHYHLWYLLYYLYTLPICYLLLRWIRLRQFKFVIPILWLVACLFYAYNAFLPKSLRTVWNVLSKYSTLFTLLPLELTGVIIAKAKPQTMKYNLIGFFLSFAMLISEAFILRNIGVEKYSYILFTLPTAYFLFRLLLLTASTPSKATGLLASISMYVYCIHPMILETLGAKVSQSLLKFALVAVLSTLLSVAIHYIRTVINQKKESKCSNS